jgi:hypothetical protein
LALNPDTQPHLNLHGRPLVFTKPLEFSAAGSIWSGILPAKMVTRLINAADEKCKLTATLALKNDGTITGVFGTSGFDQSYRAGFEWKLHYRPFWEATRLGRFSLGPHLK